MPKFRVTLNDGREVVVEEATPEAAARKAEQEVTTPSGAPSQPIRLPLSGRTQSGAKPEDISELGKTALRLGIPTATGMLGAAGGTALGGPAGGLAGAAAGGAGGVALNQALGLEEPSVAQIGLGAAAPAVGTSISKIARGALSRFAPVSAMRRINAVEQARGYAETLRTGQDVNALWETASQYNPVVSTETLSRTLSTLKETADQAGVLKDSKVARIVTGLQKMIEDAGDEGIPLQQIDAWRHSLGELVGETARSGGRSHGAYKKMLGSIYDDLDAAASQGGEAGEGVAALRAAIQTSKQEFAADDLARTVDKFTSAPRVADNIVDARFGKIADEIERGQSMELFRKSVPKAEVDKAISFFKELNRLPALPPPAGVEHGSGRTIGFGALGSVVGAAGAAVLSPDQIATISGVTGGLAAASSFMIARMATSELGRRALRYLIRPGGPGLTPSALAMSFSLLRAGAAPPAGPGDIEATPALRPQAPSVQRER